MLYNVCGHPKVQGGQVTCRSGMHCVVSGMSNRTHVGGGRWRAQLGEARLVAVQALTTAGCKMISRLLGNAASISCRVQALAVNLLWVLGAASQLVPHGSWPASISVPVRAIRRASCLGHQQLPQVPDASLELGSGARNAAARGNTACRTPGSACRRWWTARSAGRCACRWARSAGPRRPPPTCGSAAPMSRRGWRGGAMPAAATCCRCRHPPPPLPPACRSSCARAPST